MKAKESKRTTETENMDEVVSVFHTCLGFHFCMIFPPICVTFSQLCRAELFPLASCDPHLDRRECNGEELDYKEVDESGRGGKRRGSQDLEGRKGS